MFTSPTHRIKYGLAHKVLISFICDENALVYLSYPCLNLCLFCPGEYDEITPSLNQAGVCILLMSLLSGNNQISGEVTFVYALLGCIWKTLGCN